MIHHEFCRLSLFYLMREIIAPSKRPFYQSTQLLTIWTLQHDEYASLP